MSRTPSGTPILIIGAGVGGLAAAIRLAAAGRRVMVLEQNEAVGGKMGEVRAAGFRWDTGPSVITMRHVLADLFAAAGRRLEDYLDLVTLEPLTRYFWPDCTVLDVTRDWPRLAAQIEALEPRDVAGFAAFLAYAARLHRLTGPAFIYGEAPSWRTLTRVSPTDALGIDGLRTMDRAIRGYVRSPYLRQLLGRFATYVGASPYQAPATLNVIAHVELTGGVWYPRGGVYAIAGALARLAGELGVEVRTSTSVSGITVDDGAVSGVTLADGAHLPARAVVANVDAAVLYDRLLPAAAVPARWRDGLKGRDRSCSGFILLLGVAAQHPGLAHHNIFFSSDYRREFESIFRLGLPPADPTIYVAITSKADPDHAPPGCENWFVLVNAPPLGSDYVWDADGATRYRDLVLSELARRGYDLSGRLLAERILTPVDLERLTGAWRGALYGQSANSRWAAFRRPPNRDRHVRGLYLAGGTAHPGGGVPMVALSGKAAAEAVLADRG